jgi:hypothetical protein
MDEKDLHDIYQDRISSQLIELGKVENNIIEIYNSQWMDVNSMIEKGEITDRDYVANSYGLKINDNLFAFQLDGLLPFMSSKLPYHIREGRKTYNASRYFIIGRLKSVCAKLKPSQIKAPVGVAVIHYGGRKLFDIDNRQKKIIINSLKFHLYKDDTFDILDLVIEKHIQSSEEKTMIFVGESDNILMNLHSLINQHSDIKKHPNAVVGDIPFLTRAGFEQPKNETKTVPILNKNSSFF